MSILHTLGLKHDDQVALMNALVSTASVKTRIELMDLQHNHLEHLTDRFVDGQVDVDLDASNTTRQLTMTLADPRRNLPFDSDSPSASSLYLDRMIRALYCVNVPSLGWVEIPVFTGPISTNLSRDGDFATVTCYGKEWLAQGDVWHATTYKKGRVKTGVIHDIMTDLAGEDDAHLDIPSLPGKLPRDLALARYDKPWAGVAKMANSLNRQAFYDARGQFRVRRWPEHVHLSFNDSRNLVSQLRISYSGDIINAVHVIGGTPKGQKHPVHASAVAPANHPLSPQRLGRNGVPRFMTGGSAVTNSHLKTTKDCQDLADRILNDKLTEQVQAEFDCLPGAVVLADPGDHCHAADDDGSVTFRLRKFTLPLVAGNTASVGYHKNVINARSKRERGHHGHSYRHSGPTKVRKSRG